MSFAVYSFKNVIGEIATKLSGNFALNSSSNTSIGLGSITVSMANDLTIQDISVDGGIIIWPVATYNGSIALTMQQTSPLHSFLLQWCSDLKTALGSLGVVNSASGSYTQTNGALNWASTSIILNSVTSGMPLHILTGVSPQKVADKSYAAQGADVTWNLLAGNIESYAGSFST